MREILQAPDQAWVYEGGEKAYPKKEAGKRFGRLHVEAMFTLQIVLAVGEFRPGWPRSSSLSPGQRRATGPDPEAGSR